MAREAVAEAVEGQGYADLLAAASSALQAGKAPHCLQLLDRAEAIRPEPTPRHLRIEAKAAQKARQPLRALRAWQRHDRIAAIAPRDKVDYLRAVVDGGDVARGFEMLAPLLRLPETAHAAATYAGSLHDALGHFSAAQEAWQAAVETASEREQFRARLTRAHGWRKLGNAAAAIADYAALMLARPDSLEAACGAMEAYIEIRQFAAVEALLATYQQTHPNAGALLRIKALLLNQDGDEGQLIGFLRTVLRSDVPAKDQSRIVAKLLSGRRGLFLLSETKGTIRQCCEGVIPAAAIDAMLETPDALLQLQDAEARLQKHPVHGLYWLQASADRASALISAGRLPEAERQIDHIGAVVAAWPYFPPRHAKLREWLDVRRGAVAAARHSWRSRRGYQRISDRRVELTAARQWSGDRPAVAVFCQLRNERPIIESFLAHYRRGGIECFTMVDNGSTDGTFEFLGQQPDVELFSTREDFRRAKAGNDWINPLIGRREFTETLCLRVDADEHLVFPFYEERSFDELWHFMRREGSEAISGRMLDLFPERLSLLDDPDGGLGSCRYFDPSAATMPLIDCPYVKYVGGARSRLLDGKFQSIGKVSGVRGGGDIEYLAASHSCSPARVSALDIALLHYKFHSGFLDKVDRALREKQHAMASQEYAHYRRFADRMDQYLPGPDSVIFEGTGTLLSQGICRSPADWTCQ